MVRNFFFLIKIFTVKISDIKESMFKAGKSGVWRLSIFQRKTSLTGPVRTHPEFRDSITFISNESLLINDVPTYQNQRLNLTTLSPDMSFDSSLKDV